MLLNTGFIDLKPSNFCAELRTDQKMQSLARMSQKGKHELLKGDQETCYTAFFIGLSYLNCFRFHRTCKFFLWHSTKLCSLINLWAANQTVVRSLGLWQEENSLNDSLRRKGWQYFGRVLDTFIAGIKGWRSFCGRYTFHSAAKGTDNQTSKRMRLGRKKGQAGRQQTTWNANEFPCRY